jgi:hypothetical protein
MNTIPEQFQIQRNSNQNMHLIDGELKKWNGKQPTYFLPFEREV